MYASKRLILYQFMSLAFSGFANGSLFGGKQIKIVRMDGRCRGKHVPLEAFIQGVKIDTKVAIVQNFTVLVKEDLLDNLKISLTLTRCKSRENLDSCEEFMKQENIDFCLAMNPDSIIASPMAIPLQPKFKCPFKKNVYHAYNLSYNLAPFLIFNIDGWYWKTKTDIFSPKEKNRLIACVYVETYVAS